MHSRPLASSPFASASAPRPFAARQQFRTTCQTRQPRQTRQRQQAQQQ
ncbi:MAG: hypothetical protein R2708_06820 [Vicinamibacterales bacterium]